LGAAPGVGKTYAMLDEGWRRRERGADVVIGLVMTHDRTKTIAQMRDLEVVPPRRVEYRGRVWEEMDVDAILARRPQVVLVDELAHTDVPGSRYEKRWQDVEELLVAGIEVISTVNIQHLESVNDVVNQITGVVQRETVPDAVVRRADQIELVDMSPEALRRRMAHGNVYPSEKVDAALGNYFRVGNLAALRELALLWVADRVEDSLQAYMTAHGIAGPWETRERVLVALTGAAGGDHLIRRAARMARRAKGDLVGVHVVSSDGLTKLSDGLMARHRELLEELGGTYHEVAGGDVASALVGFAAAQHATQLVVGASRRSRWTELARGSVINDLLRLAKDLDVHVISTEASPRKPPSGGHAVRIRSAQGRDRMVMGLVLGVLAFGPLTLLVAHESALRPGHHGPITSAAGFLVYLGVVVVIAAVGGVVPALVAAVAAAAVVDWYLIPPYGSFAIARGVDVGYLGAFVVGAVVVAAVVEQGARRRVEAVRWRDEADTVRALADRLVQENPPEAVVEEIHAALDRQCVALLCPVGDTWVVDASAGEPVVERPDQGERFDLADGHVLVMTGTPLRAEDHRRAAALVSYLQAVLTIDRLRCEASDLQGLAQANELRTALLDAVSHDLRTPLASIRALTTGWLAPDVHLSEEDTRDSIAAIDQEAKRLGQLVDNLLDMSRLRTGALNLTLGPVGLDEIVPAALAGLSPSCPEVTVNVPETLARVEVDAALLERAVANVIDNAVRHCPDGSPVRVEAGEVAGRVDLRVVDRGPGVPLGARERLFRPFQRLGDIDSDVGVGLGLAVAKGFVEAMGGEISMEDTPGGGLTLVISLPVAADLGGLVVVGASTGVERSER
jgi:two-component system sensor histidine kinase KdpD